MIKKLVTNINKYILSSSYEIYVLYDIYSLSEVVIKIYCG